MIIENIKDGNCNVGVVLYPADEENLLCRKYMDEKLSICLPADHEIIALNKTTVTFDDIDGYNCLLRSQLGFWSELVYRKMPSSKFLVILPWKN